MIFLFDTNAVSDFMDRHAVLDQHLATLAPDDDVITCTTVRGEILYGIERLPVKRRRDALHARADSALSGIFCEQIPAIAAEHYARIKRDCAQRGATLDENDLWIASAALALDAILVSRDADFQSIEKLRVENWTR